jgi:hypothetical protein
VVGSGYSFAFSRPITIVPAPPFPCVLFFKGRFLFFLRECRFVLHLIRHRWSISFVCHRVECQRVFFYILSTSWSLSQPCVRRPRLSRRLIGGQWYCTITVHIFHELAFVRVR